jgi:hypothetical protein
MSTHTRVERSAMVVQALHDAPDDRGFWHARTVGERLAALEAMRRVIYGRRSRTPALTKPS